MLMVIGRKFSREDPKIPALPCDIFHSFRNTSVLYRFGGRLSGTPFFFTSCWAGRWQWNIPACCQLFSWGDFKPKLGQAALASAVRSVTGGVMLQSGSMPGAVGLWGLCDIVAGSLLVLLAWPKLLGFAVCSW